MTDCPDSTPTSYARADDEGLAVSDGASLPWRAWGARGLPGVVMIHGGTAHQHWWDHIAPRLAVGRRVVTFDLAGHGDSTHLPSYGHRLWGEGALAVADAAGVSNRPVLVGHSMGGTVCVDLALRRGAELGGLIVVESVIDWVSDEDMQRRIERGRRRRQVHPPLEEAVARFHTIPESDLVLPELVDKLARSSLRLTSEGWTWKFDLKIFGQEPLTPNRLVPLDCPVAIARGEHGTMSAEIAEEVRRRLAIERPVHVIRGAGHHVLLEQPEALVTYLDYVLTQWSLEATHMD